MTIKQERDRQRRRWEQQQRKQAEKQAQQATVARGVTIAAVLVVLLGVIWWIASSVGGSPATTANTGLTGSVRPTASVAQVDGCTPAPAVPGTSAQLKLPDDKPVAGKTYVATVTTNCGDIQFTLDGAKAPMAVASFKQLAEADYWKDSPCHRLTASDGLKVLQCGDPTGSGSGGPGYGFAVENAPKDGKYPRGTLAMARTQDPKTGNGGQFFIVWGDSELPVESGGYSIFGTVTSGLDIVDKIAKAGIAGSSPQDGAPAAPISILRVALTEKKA